VHERIEVVEVLEDQYPKLTLYSASEYNRDAMGAVLWFNSIGQFCGVSRSPNEFAKYFVKIPTDKGVLSPS
jgi:hypothetical protein